MTINPDRAPVKAHEDYTFDELCAHLHDHHGYNAETQAEDEESNGTDPAVIARIRDMTREEAISRLPFHLFMSEGVSKEEGLRSAQIQHAEDHGNNYGGGGAVHFHPGSRRK